MEVYREGIKMNICDILLKDYVPEQPLMRRKLLSTGENRVYYKAKVDPERETIVFKVDGCIITEGRKCDKLILAKTHVEGNDWSAYFVELKTSAIEHAIVQLEGSVRHAVFSHDTVGKKFARIVARAFPANNANPLVEKARQRFRKEYRCELKTLKSHQPEII